MESSWVGTSVNGTESDRLVVMLNVRSQPDAGLLLLFRASAYVAPKSCLKVFYQMIFVEWLA